MKKLTKKISAVIAMVLVVALLAACGGGSSSGNYDQGVTDDEILVGNVFGQSGAFAFIGVPIVESARAVVERANAHGGIGGRTIRWISYDDGFDPTVGHTLIERLLEEHRVFALAGISGGQAATSLDYMLDFGVPIVNMTGGMGTLYSEHNPGGMMFNIQPANTIDGPLLLANVLARQVYGPNRDQYLPDDARIGLFLNNTDAGHEHLNSMMALARELGIEDRLDYEFVTPDIYMTVIQRMMNDNVQVLINGTLDGAGIVASMEDAGWLVPVFSHYGQSTITSFAAGTYHPQRPLFATIWAEDTSPQALEMLADMRDSLNYIDMSDAERDGFVDNGFARAGYMMGVVLVEALQRIYDMDLDWTWENFLYAMESAPFESMGGVPAFSFANGRRMGVESLALWEFWVNANGEAEVGVISEFNTVDEILAPWRVRTGR